MYEPVDLTEQSATNAATGSTMQGDLTECSVCFDFKCQLGKNISPHPPLIFLQGFQLIQKEIINGLRENLQSACFVSKCSTSCLGFFLHHQIDLAQRDGKKILLSMINAVSRILCLDFDFPENYTHINQVLTLVQSCSNHFSYFLLLQFCNTASFFLCTVF